MIVTLPFLLLLEAPPMGDGLLLCPEVGFDGQEIALPEAMLLIDPNAAVSLLLFYKQSNYIKSCFTEIRT